MPRKIPTGSKRSGSAATALIAEQHTVAKKITSAHPARKQSLVRNQIFPIVGVGASAGGLEAFTALLKHLPCDSGMAFVLIQHLDPKHPSQLTELLSKATRMPVLEVETETAVKANHVYVIAPGVCLSLSAGRLQVESRRDGRNLPIDQFFRSLAADRDSKAIGIVLWVPRRMEPLDLRP